MSNGSRITVLAAVAAVGFLPATFLFLLLTAVGSGAVSICGTNGTATLAGPRSWTSEQVSNAHTVIGVVLARQLPRRAAVLAVATAIVESGLRNLASGDRDSLGLFQQRPSQGWGSPRAILNPSLSTGSFLDRLVAVPGWSTLPPGVAEQLVQRSAFPDRYAPAEIAAHALVSLFWTGPDTPTPTPDTRSVGSLSASLSALGRSVCSDGGESDVPLAPRGAGARAMPPGLLPSTDSRARAAVAFAVAQLGKPYVWGATGPNAFDCSGLVQAAWAAAGVPVSRSTATQIHDGQPVSDLRGLRPGDLLFIPGDRGTAARPGHVGLYVGSTARGEGLVIDAYDSRHGVIVEPLTTWAPKIVAVRRVIPAATAPAAGGDLR